MLHALAHAGHNHETASDAAIQMPVILVASLIVVTVILCTAIFIAKKSAKK